MSTVLARIKTGYTNGGRGLGMALMGRFRSLPFTPNQLTVAGLSLNAVAGVLIYEQHFVWATVAFVAGSILDILDGALARSHGKLTQFGSFLDSTTDRISEGLVLGAIALVLSEQGHVVALASVFVALVGSFLVSYTRAKAEALGLVRRGRADGPGRADRARGGGAAVRRPRVAALCDVPAGGADRIHGLPAGQPCTQATRRGGLAMAETASTNGSNGHKKSSGKVRVAIVGVGNCASALVQGVHYYRDAKPDEFVPGLMHVDLGGYHISDIEFSAAFDVDADKVGRDLGEAIGRGQNNTVRFCEVPEMGVPVQRGMTHDGIGKYLSHGHQEVARRDRRRRAGAQGHQHRRRRLVPAGRLRAGHQVVRRAGAAGRLRVRQLRARVHRPRAVLAAPLRAARPADHRRRHQVAGRRDHRPPPADAALRAIAACGSSAPTS